MSPPCCCSSGPSDGWPDRTGSTAWSLDLGAAALCGAFAFHSIEHVVGLSALGTAVNLAYPVGDLLLLVLVIGGTVMLTGRGSAQWYLLGIGLSVIVIGDTFNLFQSSGLASRFGSDFNAIAWPTAILVHVRFGVAAAASQRSPASPTRVGILPAGARLCVRTLHSRLRHAHNIDRVALGLAIATL